MDELKRQIRAWADTAAPAGDDHAAVTAEDVLARSIPAPAGGARLGFARGLIAAAVVLVVAAIGATVLLVGGDDREPHDVASTDSPAQPVDPLGGPVGFEVLGVRMGGMVPTPGTGEVAQTHGELAQLWADAGLAAPAPMIDLDREVVVAMTIGNGACRPVLDEFVRDGTTIEPVFVEPPRECNQPFADRTYVVAIEWSTVGDRFAYRLPAREWVPLPAVTQEVARANSPDVVVTWKLDPTDLAGGEVIGGTVTVDNRSGAPIEGTACGGFFAVRLRGPEAEQQIAWAACATTFVLPVGTSTHEIEGRTDHSSCSTIPDPSGRSMMCDPGGGTPSLPPGTYEALLDQAQPGLVPSPDPIMVTIS